VTNAHTSEGMNYILLLIYRRIRTKVSFYYSSSKVKYAHITPFSQ